MSKLLEIDGASKFFRVREGLFSAAKILRAVSRVSLEIAQGESVGLVGESGCGKSTLGKMACGLLAPDEGQILFQGKVLPPAGAGSWAAGRIQMIFQDPASSLDPRMKAAASVAEPLRAAGMAKKEALEKADEILILTGLTGMGGRYPHQFSGGQKQRIAIARAIVARPDLIICDEPVSALDASVQAQILNLLKDMRERYSPAYLFVSHALPVIGFICQRIYVMYLGQIVETGSREQLFSRAAHPYTRALMAASPGGDEAWRVGQDLKKLPPPLYGELPSPLDPPSGCRFHPRCPEARDICEREEPPFKDMGAGWRARCFFAGQ
ncbi:MAG: ABC transporter ATP-binding protein [Desulfovibrio sp.]|nr:ABC transporter ATP-binding protein [Desulfovibrio sp.]